MATEKRLIDANELKKKAEMRGHCIRPMVTNYHQCVTVRDIDNAPTVVATPVVHGRWIDCLCVKGQVYCSECATLEKATDSNYKSRYCPNCGADMRERKDNG